MNKLEDKLRFDAPIPGQGLTTNPDTPMPYETPPEFVTVEEAQQWLVDMLTSPPEVESLIEFMQAGLPIETLATQIAFSGFSSGKWTPDLMLLLLEPIIYILLFICEQSGIDYVLSFDEELEFLDSDERLQTDRHLEGVMGKVMEKVQEVPLEERFPSLLGEGMGEAQVVEGEMQ